MPATASLPQTLTPYHAKHYAYQLTRQAAEEWCVFEDLRERQVDRGLLARHRRRPIHAGREPRRGYFM